jgi:hypothetical protein
MSKPIFATLSVRLVYGLLRYKVKWIGTDDDPAEYSPEGLRNAASALRDFHERYPKHPGPPKNLRYWLRCAEKDIQPEARLDDNEPITRQRDLLRMQIG